MFVEFYLGKCSPIVYVNQVQVQFHKTKYARVGNR